MKPLAYYNENDKFAAAWLRELIKRDLIAPGDVDERSIVDVQASDLEGYAQCHFFGGIGGWSYALRLAGWPDARPVWTGSCPCQPFSSAGKQAGGTDDRHLWPYWARLIGKCRPVAIFGEQVESAIRHGWIDAVFDDLEREGYACGAACIPAAGVGAPHIRQRLWFVGALDKSERERAERSAGIEGCAQPKTPIDGQDKGRWLSQTRDAGPADGVAHSKHAIRRPLTVNREHGRNWADSGRQEAHGEFGARGQVLAVADTDGRECRQRIAASEHAEESASVRSAVGNSSGAGLQGRDRHSILGTWGRQEGRSVAGTSAWADAVWLQCRDGKARPAQPGIFPLAYGVSNRVGTLRGAGNAIVPQVAAEFIAAYMDISVPSPTGKAARRG